MTVRILPTHFSLRGLLGAVAALAIAMNWAGLTLAGHWETAYTFAIVCGAACTVVVVMLRDLSPVRLVLLGVYFFALWGIVASWMTILFYLLAVRRFLSELNGLGQAVILGLCVVTLPAAILAILGLYREMSGAYWDFREKRNRADRSV